MSTNILKQVNFISELEKLKTVTRMNRTLDGRQENSAEHSWNAALMVIALKEHAPKDCDIFRVVTMLLIHDIVEIDTGDTFLYDTVKRDAVVDEEKEAAKRIFSLLPNEQAQEMLDLWLEFEEGETIDASFAKAIDNLHPLINHPITRNDGENIGNVSKSQVIEKKKFIKDISPALWEIAQEAINKAVQKKLLRDC